MPAMHSKVPVLSLLSSLDGCKQNGQICEERKINRAMLVEVAPDREKLLTKTDNIEEIRQSLKLRGGPSYPHWLHIVQNKHKVKVGDPTTRMSAFGRLNPGDPKVELHEDRATESRSKRGVRRRVLSASSLEAPQTSFSATAYKLTLPDTPATPISTYGNPNLSTLDKLISPRPLGPTHILVVYASQPSKNTFSTSQKRVGSNVFRDSRRTTLVAPTFPEVLEVPINDLLFLMNLPNLKPPSESGNLSVLPSRREGEMPKVMLRMPHLETFPELVIYLHTKNQEALFRALVPECIRDLMHPLPPARLSNVAPNTDMVSAGCGFPTFEVPKVKKFLGRLFPDTNDPLDQNVDTFQTNEPVRTSHSVAVEIAEVTLQHDVGNKEDPLLFAAANLTALRDNLDRIGYYDTDLWNQLLGYQDIVLRALSCRASE